MDAPPILPKTKIGVEFRVAVSPKIFVKRDMFVGKVAEVPKPSMLAPIIKVKYVFANKVIKNPKDKTNKLRVIYLLSVKYCEIIGAKPLPITKNKKNKGVAAIIWFAPSGNLDEYVVNHPPSPLSIPTSNKLKIAINQAVGFFQILGASDSEVKLFTFEVLLNSDEFKKIAMIENKSRIEIIIVGKSMLELVPKYAINGWQIIAPTPQKKFKIFNAEVVRDGLISAINILIDGSVVPIPIPFKKNPR